MKSLPTRPITFEEFLEWCEPDTRAEWVNGKVVLMSPVSFPHQRIVLFLSHTLGIYVEQKNLGQLLMQRFLMKLDAVPSAREPDAFFVIQARESLIENLFLNGPADLAVEVISPWSRRRDTRDKLREYELAGVREYWLIDPQRKTASFHRLGPNGRYAAVHVADGVFHSQVVDGFFLRLEWLWQDPPPLTLDVLRELGVLKRGE